MAEWAETYKNMQIAVGCDTMEYSVLKPYKQIHPNHFIFVIDSMDTVDTLPHQLPLPSSANYTHLHLPRRSLSPAEEKATLIRKIEALTIENQTLEQKQSNLQGTIYDLRKLLAVVGRESAEEVGHLHSRNKKLKEKAQRLCKGLKYAYESGKHLQKCAQYWGEFLQQ